MKFYRLVSICLALSILMTSNVFGKTTELGFFGGISEGERLPKTTEIMLAKPPTTSATGLAYKEVILLSGTPYTFEGTLSIRSTEIKPTDMLGSFSETHTVRSSETSNPDITIARAITFDVNFRREEDQLIKDYEVKSWTETITIPGGTYRLDARKSRFGVSVIEDQKPAVTYYKGNISQKSVYSKAAAGGGATPAAAETVTLESSGSFYGYQSAWSKAEVHRIDSSIFTKDWQMQYQIRPSVAVSKNLQYDKNEPRAISFEGNYKEVIQNSSGLEYDIFVKPKQFLDLAESGKENISSYNSFEQLIAPDISYLKGHFAEFDIKKLFAMQVLSGDPKFYKPNQAITRGAYMMALVKAIKLPITPVSAKKPSRGRNQPVVSIVFPDVTEDRPEYPYIMAAYEKGLAIGREEGHFFTDKPIDRQEAIVILVRTLGLENLGLDPTPITPFADDHLISNWAKREIYAAYSLGLIKTDENGNFNPKKLVSKAEAAAFLNRLIDYCRTDLSSDYTDHIVNYAN